MLNEEVKPRTNSMADDAMKSPCNKQNEREQLARDIKEFLRMGKINELPPSQERAESLRF